MDDRRMLSPSMLYWLVALAAQFDRSAGAARPE
jgi:hypothetical protein